MKERINRLARGIIDYEKPEMSWQPEMVEETARAGSVSAREIFVSSRNRMNVKGFVYSSNPRVKVSKDNNSFGGLRCHIPYEVDTSWLEPGSRIEGSFHLVTNCGEVEIPYEFTVDSGAPGEKIASLKTAQDFFQVAAKDQETALRLLDYEDFVRAPFMQDLHVRALYDGLRNSHGSRQNFMEEFLIALGVKKPIRLMTDSAKKVYRDLAERTEDSIVIRRDSWGYVSLDAEADGDFLYLPRKNLTQADFSDDALRLPFVILPEQLHTGKNCGAIRIHSTLLETVIPIEVIAGSGADPKIRAFQKQLSDYLMSRVGVAAGAPVDIHTTGKMARDLEKMRRNGMSPELDEFLTIDKDILGGHLPEEDRVKWLESHGFGGDRWDRAGDRMAALLAASAPDVSVPGEKGSTGEAGGTGDEDVWLGTELGRISLTYLEELFQRGLRSPFLYRAALGSFELDPERLRNAGLFEILTLNYGVRKAQVSRSLALRAAEVFGGMRRYQPVATRVLMALYEKYREEDILTAVLALLIRGGKRESRYFSWYERGISAGISLTRLYEYYLYALPKGYRGLLPEKVLVYFSLSRDLDEASREKLFSNILNFGDKDSPLYAEFVPMMEQFALDELFKGRINSRLAVIYHSMIYEEQIDENLAKTLPSILRAVRIECRVPEMRYVVVVHEELMQEDAYPLENGHAYVPLFSDRDVLLFQDSDGNRYASVKYARTPAMTGVDGLVDACFAIYPQHAQLLVNACYAAGRKEELTGDDAGKLALAERTMKLHPLFREKILEVLLKFYQKRQEAEGLSDTEALYLQNLNKDQMDARQRNTACAILAARGDYRDAWAMYTRYYLVNVEPSRLAELASHVILDSLFAEDSLMLDLAFRLLRAGKADSVILDYLCEHYNGTTEEMYQVFTAALRDHVEMYDLEERLVAQMLFTGSTARLDVVFEQYAAGGQTSENVVRAYFTVRCEEYFFNGRDATDKVFAYLERVVESAPDMERLPDIYLIALSKYYSTLADLAGPRRELCQNIVNLLIRAGRVFAYFKDLARFIIIPGNILDKEMIEYHGSKDRIPYLKVRILPEEEEFHDEVMRQVYYGVYIHEKVLFEGEIMEYRIEEDDGRGGRKTVSSGSVSCREVRTRAPGNRFACLNEMSLALELKNDCDLWDRMVEYLKKEAAVAKLFPPQ